MGDGFIAVAPESALAGNRALVQVPPGKDGRYVAVIRHRGAVHALDATCYHMGGPLLMADIEDVGEFGACITCPWHRYQITLATGHKIYQGMDGAYRASGECKQRVHEAKLEGGKVLVKLRDAEPAAVTSDDYAFKKPAPAQGGAGGGLRSGHAMGRGHSLGRMVANTMRGGDGVAPWAVPPPARPANAPRGTAPALPSPSGSAAPSFPPAPGLPVLGVGGTAATAHAAVTRKSVVSRNCFVLYLGVVGGPLALRGLGRHVELGVVARRCHWPAEEDGAVRLYTPFVSPECSPTEIAILIKCYPKGRLTPRLADAAAGDIVSIGAPLGGLPPGFFAGGSGADLRLKMVAGGTGVTPMLQILYHLVDQQRGGRARQKHGVRSVDLLCSNRTSRDILWQEPLAALAKEAERVGIECTVTHTVSDETDPGWHGAKGKVSPDMLRRLGVLSAGDRGVKVLICGPLPFNESVAHAVATLGFKPEDVHEFA
ncbi:NADH-cytochrome b5 reductase 1 [Diplonema papillatum]|nr:NADH-cytochrome b5 reductase 1 [Diplonema papillatum]